MGGNYILDSDGQPQLEPDVLKWNEWFQTADRIVEKTDIGGVIVSTVFLTFDHNWSSGPPILWETMVFGGGEEFDGAQERYSSLEDAKVGHAAMIERVRKSQQKQPTKAKP